MKILRRLAIAFAVFILVVAGAIAWIAATFDAARLKQEAVAAVARHTGRSLTIEGDPALVFWPRLGIALGRTTLAERDGSPLARVERARIAVAVLPLLQRQVAMERVELDGLALALVKREDGTLNVADLFAAAPTEAEKVGAGETATALATIDIAGIRIADAQLDWRDETTGSRLSLADLDLVSGPVHVAAGRADIAALALDARGKLNGDAFSLKLEVPQLAVAPDRTRGEHLHLTTTLEGKERRIGARLALTGLDGNAAELRARQFGLDVEAQLATTRLSAQLASPLELNLERRSLALAQLAGKLSLAHPRLPANLASLPLTGSVRVDFARQTAQLKLASELEANHARLALDIDRFAPLALGFDFAIDTLDLDPFMPPRQTAGGGAGQPPTASDTALDFSALAGLNLHGTARVGQLRAAGIDANDLRLQLAARNGRLDIAPLTAALYGGRLEAALSVDAPQRRIALRQTLSGVQVGPLLHAAAGTDLLEGRGDVGLDLAGSGATVAALKKSLAGSARLALADGALKGYDIGRRLRELQSLLKQGKDIAADATQKTDFSELSASFRVAGGVARNDDLRAKSPLLRLAGAGDIDIGNDRLDYRLKASLVATATGQGGKELDKLKGLTLPVHLTGPLAKPDWQLDLAGLIDAAAKDKLEEKGAVLREKAKTQLKDKLKGLLGK